MAAYASAMVIVESEVSASFAAVTMMVVLVEVSPRAKVLLVSVGVAPVVL